MRTCAIVLTSIHEGGRKPQLLEMADLLVYGRSILELLVFWYAVVAALRLSLHVKN
jgi:hypothetical protein